MARTAALALAFLALMTGEAQATSFPVVVMPGLGLEALADWEGEGAVGLLVPGAGPETSETLALAALVRGQVRNSLLDGLPAGPPLIAVASAVPDGGPHILVGLPAGGAQPNDRRYPIVVVGPGFEGVLVSDSTRIPGLVSIADVAPTALGRESGLSSEPAAEAAERLLALDARIRGHNAVRLPATLLACGLVVLLALALPGAAALALAAVLAANLALGAAGATSAWLVLPALALAVALAAALAVRRLSPLVRGAVLAGAVAAYLVALAIDQSLVALSPFGPTQNARFYGFSNLLGTLVLVPALAGAAALGARLGPLAFAAVAALAVLTVAGARLGADGGGAIVLAAGFGVLVFLLADGRRALRAGLAGATAAAVGALVALDIATSPATHVTRAAEEGPLGLGGDLARRLALSYERVAERWYVALLLAAGVAFLAVRALRLARSALPRGRKALPLAVAAAVGASLLVNDSPNDVVLVGLTSYLAAEAVMLRGRCAAAWSSLSLSSSSRPVAGARPSPPSPRP